MNIFDIALIDTGLNKDKFIGVGSTGYGDLEYWEEKLYSDIEDLKSLGKYIKEYRDRRSNKDLFEDCSCYKITVHDFMFDLDIVEDDEGDDISMQVAKELGEELEMKRDLTMFQIMINVNKDDGTWIINFHAD